MTTFDELFGTHRIMVVLRGFPVQETVKIAQMAWSIGIELLEVPIGKPEQVASLSAAVAAGREQNKVVGAGTVITYEQVQAASAAGARYTVAPGFNPSTLSASLTANLPHLPGVATATEVQHAHTAGCQWVKVFPASTIGPQWFRAMQGPFPDTRYVATGGITVATAPEYLASGAQIVALGTAITDPEQHHQVAELVKAYRGAELAAD
jgi:2-dehydro-3-deoxyphosphogluconate aldolase/(4S)-4-hydroxy-2-oxoglutarate aldolase